MTRSILLATAAILVGTAAAHAQSLTFQTIDNPADPTFNQLLGINDHSDIVGYYGIGTVVGRPNIGYSINPPYTNFVSVNVPQSVQTQNVGINAFGVICGFWSNTNLGAGDANYGFIRTPARGHADYLLVNDPLGTANPPVTQVLGVNNFNEAVGFYSDAAGNSHGFELSVKNGRYTPVDVAGTTSAQATSINRTDLVAGFALDANGSTVGFEKQLFNHTDAVKFQAPGSTFTQFFGVNARGFAVGSFTSGGIPHGLFYQPGGAFMQVDAPGAAFGTVLNGINDAGQAVGFYMDAAMNTHGVLVSGLPKK